MKRLFSLLRRFHSDNRGVTALEFAFAAPVILYFLVGMIEFSYLFMANNMLENAANHASRTGKTGYIAANMTREEYLKKQISERIDGLMNPDKLSMSTRVYESFDDIGKAEAYIDANHNNSYDFGETYTDSNGNGQWDTDKGSAGLGDAGKIVVYDFTYDWDMMTPLLSNLLANNGKVTITTRIVLKNEPYNEDDV